MFWRTCFTTLAAAAWLSGCSSAPPVTECGPENCGGCCDGMGVCQPGETYGLCGISGLACDSCVQGQVCAVGKCGSGGVGGGSGGVGGGSGGGVGGGSGAGGGAPSACAGILKNGQCTANGVQYCFTGAGVTPRAATYRCPTGTTCTSNAAESWCARSQCEPGALRCNGTALQQCGSNQAWGATQACSTGCKTSNIGAFCPPAIAFNTITGTLKYMSKSPNTQLTGWGAAAAANASGVSVLVIDSSNKFVDASETAPDGTFSVKVPATPGANDRLVFAAAGGDGTQLLYAIKDPGLTAGEHPVNDQLMAIFNGTLPMASRLWSWGVLVSGFANGSTFTVTEAQGSGALNLFDMQRIIWKDSLMLHGGKQGLSLAIWWGLNASWSCGACFADFDTQEGTQSHLFIGGTSPDQSYWSDWVTSHEMGHWRQASFGTSPNEGGTHILSIKTFPGQAYSEGYATYHAASVMNNPIAFDIQQGPFWIDFNQRLYSFGPSPIPRAQANQPLDQRIDENDVAAMLWQMSKSSAGAVPFIDMMVASEHMNSTPWFRGYKRHTWDIDPQTGTFTNVVITNESSPYHADLFDSMVCAGFSTSAINAATGFASFYPYNATSIPATACSAQRCYACRESNGTCNTANSTAACGKGGNPCQVCATGQSCTNGVCQ